VSLGCIFEDFTVTLGFKFVIAEVLATKIVMATARASSDNVSIKIRCNSTHVHARDAVRRFAIPKQLFTYEKLIEMIHGYYPHTKKSMFKLQYRDGEGDNITVRGIPFFFSIKN